jgi:hypothetical protein
LDVTRYLLNERAKISIYDPEVSEEQIRLDYTEHDVR